MLADIFLYLMIGICNLCLCFYVIKLERRIKKLEEQNGTTL